MIKTEKEFLEAKKRLAEEEKILEIQRVKLKKAKLSKNQIKLAIDPLASFMLQLKEEINEYEKLKKGDFGDLTNLYGIGRTLVALRIYKGMKQGELAQKLGVAVSQVSRDESNEYHGAAVEKIQRILDALGVTLKTKVALSA
jgi:DNA-binding Xre family transcriptional regulator